VFAEIRKENWRPKKSGVKVTLAGEWGGARKVPNRGVKNKKESPKAKNAPSKRGRENQQCHKDLWLRHGRESWRKLRKTIPKQGQSEYRLQ